MKKRQHEQRFLRALHYLENHYTDGIDLNRIADAAGLSPWHWHRLYRDVMGETLHTTVKWMRLHRAAWLISYTDKPFADIARECGYNNAQSFARSFRDEYGLSPQQYRERPPLRYPVHLETRAPVTVAMLAHPGECQRLGDTFYQLESLLRLRGAETTQARTFSIHPAIDPLHAEKHVAITVAPEYATPPLQTGEIAGGRYAVLRHRGSYADLDYAYEWFAQEWFAATELRISPDCPVIIEYHDTCPDIPQPQKRVDLCIPLSE